MSRVEKKESSKREDGDDADDDDEDMHPRLTQDLPVSHAELSAHLDEVDGDGKH